MRVLVCDDDKDSAEALGALLLLAAPIPVSVDVVFGGRQAVETARATHPDVVILDIEMPELNGFGAAAALRSAAEGAPLLLIAVSGAPARIEAAEAESLFDHALVKPIDFDALSRLVFRPAAPEAG